MQAARGGNLVGWGVLALLSIGIALHGLSYLVLGRAHLPPDLQANGFAWPYMILVHAVAAGTALLLGPFQFLQRVRRQRPRLHRMIGRVYLGACATGAIAGGLIAPYTFAGPIAATGFGSLALLWLYTAFAGYRAVRRRDFTAHEAWMMRSFALTFAAVTLRLYLIPVGAFDLPFAPFYTAIAWVSWVPNILAVEVWLRLRRRGRPAAA